MSTSRLSSIIALGLGTLFAATSILPAQAAMPSPQPQTSSTSDVQLVRSGDQKVWRHKRGWKNNKGYRNRGYRNNRHVGVRYNTWRGHRGYRTYRPGYRRYGGYWYAPAAFTVIISPRRAYVGGNSHVRWCMNRYRSYRVSDNAFQPYNGPRQLCRSPR